MAIFGKETRTQYVQTNNPDTVNDTTPYFNAQVGQVFPGAVGGYQYVQCDSGAVAANTVGVPAAAQLAFWKNKAQYIVTNDLRFSQRNEVAGVFRNAVTAGNYCYVLQTGDGIAVKGTSGSPGDIAIANSGTAADSTSVAAGTAPTYLPLGTITAATSGGNISVDLNIPSAP